MFRKSYFYFILCLGICSCSHKNIVSEDNLISCIEPVESLYEKAAQLMHKKNFKRAAFAFSKVQESYPYSKWAMQAQLMEAYCRYQTHQYEDAIDLFTIFSKLHPHHKEIPYVYYMIGLSHYERISIVERDQEDSKEALKAFQKIVNLYPSCVYAKDAKFKINFIYNHLAAQEMSIGRFYQEEKSYLAAINRFRNVITNYQTTEQRPEALLRLAECYAILNMEEDFLSVYEILKLNHKNSDWFKQGELIYRDYIQKKDLMDKKKEDKKIDSHARNPQKISSQKSNKNSQKNIISH